MRVYSEAGLDENVGGKLRDMRRAFRNSGEGRGQMRKRDAAHMMHELVDSLRTLIHTYDPQGNLRATTEEAQREFSFLTQPE